MEPIIKFDHIGKQIDGKQIINDLNLEIEQGELFVIVGPSGSGKTTTIKMINGLHEITDGYLYINGKRFKDYDLQKLRWQMGYVLQQIALFPNMTVAQNIAVIPDMVGKDKRETKQVIDKMLQQVGLDPEQYRNRYPRELSGGEQQRVGILRALAAQPEIVLMDEPLSALDPLSRTQLQDLILELHRTLKTTIVFVTHDMKEALKIGDRIAVMRKGKVIKVATPAELVNDTQDEFITEFFSGVAPEQKADFLTRKLMDLCTGDYLLKQKPTSGRGMAELTTEQTITAAIEKFGNVDVIKVLDGSTTMGYLTRQQLLEAQVRITT